MRMKKIFALSFLLCAPFFLAGCSLEAGGEGLPGAIDAYTVVSGDFEIETRTELRGSGTVAMAELLTSSDSSNSYQLRINLLNDGSSVTLVSHSPNLSLASGFKLVFIRNREMVDARIIDGHGTTFDTVSDIESYSRVDRLDLVIDIRNEFGAPRILAWPEGTNTFDAQASYLDSDQTAHMPTGQGSLREGAATGTSWGLILNDASVTYARLGEAKL